MSESRWCHEPAYVEDDTEIGWTVVCCGGELEDDGTCPHESTHLFDEWPV